MVGERAEGDSANTSPQTDQADTPAQAQTGGDVAEALARVQEAVIEVKEGGLPESLEATIEAIDSAVREVPTGERPINSKPLPMHWRELSRRWRRARWPTSCLYSSRLNQLSNPVPPLRSHNRTTRTHWDGGGPSTLVVGQERQ
jgi:hypothetical protein